MTDRSALQDSFHAIAERVDDDMSERDVENVFLERDFYTALDYAGTGTDLRSEFTLPDDRRPDVITLDSGQRVTAVYEFKTTGRDLPPHESQLLGYMDDLRAEYGVLTNGEELRLYRRGRDAPLLTTALGSVTEGEARDLVDALRKREFDVTDPDDLNQFLADLNPVSLDERTELGQEHFFDTFRLEAGSPFADLVIGTVDLLGELRDEQEATFVQGPMTSGRRRTRANGVVRESEPLSWCGRNAPRSCCKRDLRSRADRRRGASSEPRPKEARTPGKRREWALPDSNHGRFACYTCFTL